MTTALERYVSSKLRWMNIEEKEVTIVRAGKRSVTFQFEREGTSAKHITFTIKPEAQQ